MEHAVDINTEELGEEFLAQIREYFPLQNSSEQAIFIRLSITERSPLAWLKAQRIHPQVYWSDRRGEYEVAGVGALLSFTARTEKDFAREFESLSSFLETHPQSHLLTFVGGSSFDPSKESDPLWRSFPALSFVQPEVAMIRDGAQHSLILGTIARSGDSAQKVVRRICRLLLKVGVKENELEAVSVAAKERKSFPSFDEWQLGCETALADMNGGELNKVVLARKEELSLSSEVHPADLIHNLQERSGQSYSFLYAPTQRNWFAARTPECLLHLENDWLESDALGGSAMTDAQSANGNPLQSDKIIAEHGYVVRDLLEKFSRLSHTPTAAGATELLDLPYVQHLRTPIRGQLREGVSRFDIFRTLHPTAAVGGYPQQEALSEIEKIETFSRGWYSGPIGLLSESRTELAVALRCVLMQEKKASLFAGAGLVKSSDATDEWQEIENKLSPLLQLFCATNEPS